MIKINLNRKRKTTTGGASLSGLLTGLRSGKGLDISSLKEFDWKSSAFPRIFIAIAIVYGVQWWEESIKQDKLNDMDAQIAAIQTQQDEVAKKLAKVKGYEPLKKQLEADEKSIQTKLNVIYSLMEDRDLPSRILRQLSQIIPEDVWLTSMSINNDKLIINGGTPNYNLVSDFMKNLNDSSLFSEVGLSQIAESQAAGIGKFQQFDISAKRRIAQ